MLAFFKQIFNKIFTRKPPVIERVEKDLVSYFLDGNHSLIGETLEFMYKDTQTGGLGRRKLLVENEYFYTDIEPYQILVTGKDEYREGNYRSFRLFVDDTGIKVMSNGTGGLPQK